MDTLIMVLFLGSLLALFALGDFFIWLYTKIKTPKKKQNGIYLGTL